MTGKKLGIVAFVLAILFAICMVIEWVQAPEIPDELYELMMTDMEQAQEKIEEIEDNAPILYTISSKVSSLIGLGGCVLAIISLVKMAKGNEKGKVFPILALIIIVGAFVGVFALSFAEGLKAGLEAGFETMQ